MYPASDSLEDEFVLFDVFKEYFEFKHMNRGHRGEMVGMNVKVHEVVTDSIPEWPAKFCDVRSLVKADHKIIKLLRQLDPLLIIKGLYIKGSDFNPSKKKKNFKINKYLFNTCISDVFTERSRSQKIKNYYTL